MYKRPARVLFVSCTKIATELSCELLRQQLSDYLQGRILELDQNAVMAEEMEWADLVVALDELACQRLRDTVPNRPLRCWSLPQGEQQRRVFVNKELASMVAGMRMMQRLGD